MSARFVDGWLVVSFDGDDLAVAHIGVSAAGSSEPDEWTPAFLDWHDGQRVAKIRPPSASPDRAQVWLRVAGVARPHRLS